MNRALTVFHISMFLRTDDLTLADEKVVLRRIWNTPEWVPENQDGPLRPSSVAFLDARTNEVSVNAAEETTIGNVLSGYPDFGLVSLTVGIPRQEKHIVAKTPEIPDESHRVICPPVDSSRGSRKSAARIMAEESKWVIYTAKHRK